MNLGVAKLAVRRSAKASLSRTPSDAAPLTTTAVSLGVKPLVFISHDTRDAEIAESFSNLLADASAGVLESFRSSDKIGNTGIEFGAEWYATIMAQLSSATDVVALLTQKSIDRPWILYEAGVAKGRIDATVFGVALGVPLDEVSTGPFGQFQNCNDDEDSLTKLVIQLLMRNPDAAPREQAVRMQVKMFLEAIKPLIAKSSIVENKSKRSNIDESSAKLFEEIKAMMRELPERLQGPLDTKNVRNPLNRRLYLDPGFVHDILCKQSDGGNRAGLVIVAALFRADFPWFSELFMLLYEALARNDRRLIAAAVNDLRRLPELFERSIPLSQLPFMGDKMTYILFREIPNIIEIYLNRIHPTPINSAKSHEPPNLS